PMDRHGDFAPRTSEDQSNLDRYHELAQSNEILWSAQYRKIRLLGKGGQGVVFLSERQGTDLFRLSVALKFFSPEPYRDFPSYEEDMARIADVSSRVALIQHDNLLDLQNFIAHDGIRIMVMEWVDGFDLRDLLSERMVEKSQKQLNPERWKYVRKVILGTSPLAPGAGPISPPLPRGEGRGIPLLPSPLGGEGLGVRGHSNRA
ncbi:MAG: hypothetical protein L0Y72_12225, partial [Gemmataceae bacterium]|nr:hypothetical protein [Gemmataceae bacterium]